MAIVLPVLLFGCSRNERSSLRIWATEPAPYVPQSSSGNAFDGYARAALQVEQDAPKQLLRVAFTPGMKRAAIQDSQRALSILRSAASQPCQFEFRASAPFKVPPYQKGWRLLGRVLAWSIQNAVANEDFDRAVADVVLAHKFGFDLTGGGALDASLGLAIADEARRSIAPSLGQLGAGQLKTLAQGLRHALDSKPPLDKAFENEHQNMLLAVQAVQDAYRDDSWASMEDGLESDAREAIGYLKSLKEKDQEERPAYFEAFASEADAELAYLRKIAGISARERSQVDEPKLEGDRPWRRFARHFFLSGRPLLETNDTTVARTRLLVLNSELLASVKTIRTVPRKIENIGGSVIIDPFSGAPFVYQSSGTDFSVYSVGKNFQDDGGETDESFTQPDLKLERS